MEPTTADGVGGELESSEEAPYQVYHIYSWKPETVWLPLELLAQDNRRR